MYYFYDATYILVIIGAIISLIASMNVISITAVQGLQVLWQHRKY